MARIFFYIVIALGLGTAVRAETPAGTWLTGPDKKGQVAHISLAPCGAAICGHVARTFDAKGRLVKGPNDGKRVLWDITGAAAGKYNAKVLLPAYGATVNGNLQVVGRNLVIKGCLGPVCKSQKWTRVN